MRHMVSTDQLDISTFGSIPGRDAKEAMKLLDMVMTNHRLMSRTLVTIFNDAAGCFDRIRPNMADYAMRRVGCPKSITYTHTLAQLNMTHRIKTAMGISPGSIRWNPTLLQMITIAGIVHFLGNIGGIGQGGGGSPVGWLVVLLIMIRAYKNFSPGATVTDPFGDSSRTLHVVSYVDDNSLLRSFDASEELYTIGQVVSREITSWWNLLRITGGDLALEKCTYSVMKWKWSGYANTRELLTPDEMNCSVSVQRDDGEQILLRCLDPGKAERQLGIRLSMEGNWNDEYKHREQQVTLLCQKIYCAQLSHYEALMAYQFYIKSALYYALPLTVFSYDECVSLNKIILNKVLPKCGINRHTPRAVVYAPASLGGFQFDHIWTKQLSLQIEMLQCHLRRMDTLGHAILCNLNCIQLLVGRSICFLALDPHQHQYVDQTGCFGLLWMACFTLEIQCIVPAMSIPQCNNANDKMVMDVAMSDKLVCSNVRKLTAINSCRLFHGILCLSDMLSYTGKTLIMGFCHPSGGRRIKKKNIHKWPVQPEPTKWQWSVWKDFICRNFLKGNRTLAISLPPGSRCTPNRVVDLRSKLKLHLSRTYRSINESIQALPSALRYYIGDIHIQGAHSVDFVNALETGDLIGSTDGSAREDTQDGSYAFVLASVTSSTKVIFGGGKTQPSEAITSQYTEHLGVLGILMTIFSLQSCSRRCTYPPLKIWIDNKQTQERVNSFVTAEDPVSVYNTKDFDLWQLIALIKDFLVVPIVSSWVKSHQDTRGAVEDLSPEAKMNVLADSIATKMYHFSEPQPQRSPHDDEGTFLAYKGGRIYDIEESLRRIVHEPDYINYICGKRNWTLELYNSVHWRGLSLALKKFKGVTKINVTQLIHNWQNTGQQKKQFLLSSIQNKTGDERDATIQYTKRHWRCPACNARTETHLHFVFCPQMINKDATIDLRRELVQLLRKWKTFDLIIDLLVTFLKGGEVNEYKANTPESLTALWEHAFQGQQHLGWNSFIQGFWHSGWCQVQQQHIKLMGEEQRNDQWISIAIHGTLTYVYGCWKLRNDFLHKDNTSEEATIKLHTE